jgi:hypothetical protein
MYACGLRIGEAASLEIGAVDGNNRLLRIIGKGNKERIVPLPEPMLLRPASALEDPCQPALAIPHPRRHRAGWPRDTHPHLLSRRPSGRYPFGDTPQPATRLCDTAA